jgi:FKBP-type peptidyl-prolyl cis-trans isomerase
LQAWDEGVATMQIGEVARITATPDYACAPTRREPRAARSWLSAPLRL